MSKRIWWAWIFGTVLAVTLAAPVQADKLTNVGGATAESGDTTVLPSIPSPDQGAVTPGEVAACQAAKDASCLKDLARLSHESVVRRNGGLRRFWERFGSLWPRLLRDLF